MVQNENVQEDLVKSLPLILVPQPTCPPLQKQQILLAFLNPSKDTPYLHKQLCIQAIFISL